MKKQINWQEMFDKANHMSGDHLRGAIADILNTLPSADALDRTDNGNRGGYYRDEISIYRKVIHDRGTFFLCEDGNRCPWYDGNGPSKRSPRR